MLVPTGSRAAFVTQRTVDGSFAANAVGAPNAWVTADAICNEESAAASLPGHFVALISYAGHLANTRLDPGVPYAMYYQDHTEGPDVVLTAEDLFANGPDARVDRFANGNEVPAGNATVWTGADDHGGVDQGTQCAAWTTTDSDEQARTGYPVPVASADSTEWINASLQPCAFPHRLYCFETRD